MTASLVFDESLSAVARGLHVAEIGAVATACAAALYLWLERRGRWGWMQVPTSRVATSRLPYRESEVVASHLGCAPWRVRAASFFNFAFGHAFAPLILLALTKYPFDGIAIPLVPGIALVLLNWWCGFMLLARSPLAHSTARSAAVGSILANAGLLVLAAAHFVVVELNRRDGIQHACSSSVTFVVILFALASLAQSAVMLSALRSHGRELSWQAT